VGFSLNYKDFDTYSTGSSATINTPTFRAIVDLGSSFTQSSWWDEEDGVWKNPKITENYAFHSALLAGAGYNMTLDFGGSYTVTGMILMKRGGLDLVDALYKGRVIEKFTIEYSNDGGSTWSTEGEHSTTQDDT
jgi:hypothetical protein